MNLPLKSVLVFAGFAYTMQSSAGPQSLPRTFGLNSYITRQPIFFKLREIGNKKKNPFTTPLNASEKKTASSEYPSRPLIPPQAVARPQAE